MGTLADKNYEISKYVTVYWDKMEKIAEELNTVRSPKMFSGQKVDALVASDTENTEVHKGPQGVRSASLEALYCRWALRRDEKTDCFSLNRTKRKN